MLVDIPGLEKFISKDMSERVKGLSEEDTDMTFAISKIAWFILTQYDAELEKVIVQRVQEAISCSKA